MMCKLEKWGTFRIDPCLQKQIDQINESKVMRTLSSCCGHNKYYPSIIIQDITDGYYKAPVLEWLSGVRLSEGIRPRKRYYQKDKDGYYYIPEVVLVIGTLTSDGKEIIEVCEEGKHDWEHWHSRYWDQFTEHYKCRKCGKYIEEPL